MNKRIFLAGLVSLLMVSGAHAVKTSSIKTQSQPVVCPPGLSFCPMTQNCIPIIDCPQGFIFDPNQSCTQCVLQPADPLPNPFIAEPAEHEGDLNH